ncbi:capsule assembly Wzi family protein [Stygiobacter electus]|uniref:Capsule assembly Wzi family protein n=1 Tax=Stygiobacter electus TaxID=3032292 RepID=A0AAE3P4Y5_9BACT|nr:capsule assembly Wzi family protein [Stygiobacter electus]MDF1613105.1 capsule assembly Wzi family protein [Stygiobacter electus]
MKKTILLLFLFFASNYPQTELVPISHKIYNLLLDLSKREIISNYNHADIPLSRRKISQFINQLKNKKELLTQTERNILSDLLIEFSYDIDTTLDNSISLVDSISLKNIFSDSKQKYLYSYADSNASLFLDGTGFLGYRKFDLQTKNSTNIGLGEFGFRVRGTLYENLGFYLRASTGQQINGDLYSRNVSAYYDPKLSSTLKFISEKYFETYEGYLRYESSNQAFAFMLGKEAINIGTSYIDKLFISSNTAPFDFAKLNINYKGINYTFLYGNLRGDSLGVTLKSKNIIAHRLDFPLLSNLRFGVYETVIVPNRSISFTYLNPVSFLFSADLNAMNNNDSNSMIGFDLEYQPFRNLSLQSTFLIDDYDFKLIGDKSPASNNNRFAWQFGLFYSQPFGLKNISTSLEFTHLDPFFYSHKSNMAQYTHWKLSLGHSLPPNSDELALKINYWISSRIFTNVIVKFRRTGEGLVFDSKGNLIRNYGADINRGDGLYLFKAYFLDGNRINSTSVNFNLKIEPIRQYFIDLNYSINLIDKKYLSKNYKEQLFYITVSTEF